MGFTDLSIYKIRHCFPLLPLFLSLTLPPTPYLIPNNLSFVEALDVAWCAMSSMH